MQESVSDGNSDGNNEDRIFTQLVITRLMLEYVSPFLAPVDRMESWPFVTGSQPFGRLPRRRGKFSFTVDRVVVLSRRR